MPESFDGRAITTESSPKPPRVGGENAVTNETPSASGVKGGGLDNIRANHETYEAGSTRPATSSLKRTGATVATFADATT